MTTELEPPDYQRCQCEVRTMISTPFRLGGAMRDVRIERCAAVPVWLAVELIAGKDGLRGAMTLCSQCCEKMLENADLRRRVQLQPMFHTAS